MFEAVKEPRPHIMGDGCEECGATDNGVCIEAFETLERILCDDCGMLALDEAAEADDGD